MPLQKQAIPINFSQGLDLKTDPFQVAPGRFLALQNSIFTKGGLLQKRNGFAQLPTLPVTDATTLTTFGGNLVSISNRFDILSEDTNQWLNKGTIQPLQLGVVPLVRTSYSQTTVDTAIASNGLCIAVYTDSTGASAYQIVDPATGQIIVSSQTATLESGAMFPRVFTLGHYFIISYIVTTGGSNLLRYVSININTPAVPNAAVTLQNNVSIIHPGYDGLTNGSLLYFIYGSDIGGGEVKAFYLTTDLLKSSTITYIVGTYTPYIFAMSVDTSTSNLYLVWYGQELQINVAATGLGLQKVMGPVIVLSGVTASNFTASAQNGSVTVFYENINTYTYSSVRTDYVSSINVLLNGTFSAPTIVLRSVGLASKSFIFNGTIYLLVAYGGQFQPTYFLIDSLGHCIAKLAYANGGGYVATQVLPSVNVTGDVISIGYLYKDLIESVNKSQNALSVNNIYSQTGINLAQFTIDNTLISTAEIASDLHISGGFLWMHDGANPVEHNFHLWPEDILATSTTATGGAMTPQEYQYQVTYEWTDAQGNIFTSAPSIPYDITLTGDAVTLNIPTLRITYKAAPNPVTIVIYRWSVAQQNFYKVTSIATPIQNDTTVDSITYTDKLADSAILGNQLIYTTGGVVEDIAAPACTELCLFKSRLFLVDAEDRNLLWYSKQVIEKTPVEMSDLFTLYVSPTISAQGNTGPITAISSLDDKLIIFKKNAIYYLTGNGPDNTGANNDFSEPVFITSTVGCINQKSIVFMPNGLMFQSDKGIWLLGRDLSTNYIGAPVENYNSANVVSAINIPGTNQVRFTLDSGVTLMYDYYYGQWGTFNNIPAASSTLYQDLHTYVNSLGLVFQESPGSYLDGSNPVLMSFTTGWMNFAGVQGYERFYHMFLLGVYQSPFKLNVQFAYDYNPAIQQGVIVTSDNYSPPWGGNQLWGSDGPWGGPGNKFEARVFPNQGKFQAFQVTINELFDSSHQTIPGAGFTLSGMNLVVGMKKGYRTQSAARSFG